MHAGSRSPRGLFVGHVVEHLSCGCELQAHLAWLRLAVRREILRRKQLGAEEGGLVWDPEAEEAGAVLLQVLHNGHRLCLRDGAT